MQPQRAHAAPTRRLPDAGEVSRMLAAQIQPLCAQLLPHGRRCGREWTAGSVAGEPGRSLSVNLAGKPGVWADFATGETGDALDLVAAVLYRGCRKGAYAWSIRYLGLTGADAPPTRAAYAPPAADTARADAEAASRQRSALRLYLEAQPTLAGTPADLYLQARGIDLARLGRQPRALRFHPRCHCTEVGADLPALIAAITDGAGRHVATHRTWLACVRGTWCKAPLADPKKTLGRPRGGTIRLWRGESKKPLAQAPENSSVIIGEGIETCLSLAIACPEQRVLCAVSLANLAAVVLPDTITTVIVAADNDGDRPGARDGLQRALNHFLDAGLDVRLARSPIGKDFNDCLKIS